MQESISELKRPSHEQPSPLKIADERGFFQGQSGHLVQKSGQFLEQKRTGEQENLCHFLAMQYSLPHSAKFKQGMQIHALH
jgi:hypothetical protein